MLIYKHSYTYKIFSSYIKTKLGVFIYGRRSTKIKAKIAVGKGGLPAPFFLCDADSRSHLLLDLPLLAHLGHLDGIYRLPAFHQPVSYTHLLYCRAEKGVTSCSCFAFLCASFFVQKRRCWWPCRLPQRSFCCSPGTIGR